MDSAWKENDAKPAASRPDRSGMVWGIGLVAVGSLFLVDRLDLFEIGDLWEWWPMLGAAFGVFRILAWTSADDVGSGITWVLLAVWVMANTREWFGLDWSNSWPLVLVAVGAGMVTASLLRPAFARAAAVAAPEGTEHA